MRKLPGRQQVGLCKPGHRRLRREVEAADRLHLTAEELDPKWSRLRLREDIDDPSPDRELARRLDLGLTAVPPFDEPGDKAVQAGARSDANGQQASRKA